MELRALKPAGLMRRLSAALIVAIGMAIVWGIAAAWGVSTVDSWLESPPTSYESITVTHSGTAVIESHAYNDYQDVTYRTLEGEPIEVKGDNILSPAHLAKREIPPRFFPVLAGWGQSLGASDFARPRGGWYLIRDNEPNGRAYFIGYDEFSKMPIGYLGKSGFRRNIPPVEEWFDLGLSTGYSMGAVSTQNLAYNRSVTHYNPGTEETNLPKWMVFVLDGNRLQEVDLQARTVREIFTAPDQVVSVALLTEATLPSSAEAPASGSPQSEFRLALRTSDRVFVLDPTAGIKREFPLPESLRNESLNIYSISSDQLLCYWSTMADFQAFTEHLAWLGADGTIGRKETLQLANRRGDNFKPRLASILASVIAPIPIGWGAVVGLFVPIGTMNANMEPTYSAALAQIVGKAWPGMLIVTVVACLSSWLVWRWQRQYSRSATGAWCTFAFLLGLPGVVAYWLEMHRAKLEACDECHALVPRDRDACATCATPFPAPPQVGTEIFA